MLELSCFVLPKTNHTSNLIGLSSKSRRSFSHFSLVSIVTSFRLKTVFPTTVCHAEMYPEPQCSMLDYNRELAVMRFLPVLPIALAPRPLSTAVELCYHEEKDTETEKNTEKEMPPLPVCELEYCLLNYIALRICVPPVPSFASRKYISSRKRKQADAHMEKHANRLIFFFIFKYILFNCTEFPSLFKN